MKSRSLIIFGCVLALGIASCGGGQEEPGTSDTTAVDTTVITTPAPDTTAKVDTTLIDKSKTDTVITTTDTTVKPGKTVTTGTRETKGSSSGSKTTTKEPVPGSSEVRGSTVRRGEGGTEGGTVESKPRR